MNGLRNIFDDNAEQALNENDADMFDADEMAGFIEDDTQSDDSGRHGSGSEDDEERRERKGKGRKKREKELKKRLGKKEKKKRGGLGQGGFAAGISAEAWQDVTDAFGNGQDYAWAMEDEGEEKGEEKELKDVSHDFPLSWGAGRGRELIPG